MSVQAWSQNMTDEQAESAGARRVSKEELFATSDVVTIHLALSDRTRGIVGAPELRAMKPTAFLVNTARGAIVDEKALIDVLQGRGRSPVRVSTSTSRSLCPWITLSAACRTSS